MSFGAIKIVFLGPLTDLLEEEGEIPGESRQNSGRRRQDWAFLPRPKTPGSTTSSSESYVVRILQSHHHFFFIFAFLIPHIHSVWKSLKKYHFATLTKMILFCDNFQTMWTLFGIFVAFLPHFYFRLFCHSFLKQMIFAVSVFFTAIIKVFKSKRQSNRGCFWLNPEGRRHANVLTMARGSSENARNGQEIPKSPWRDFRNTGWSHWGYWSQWQNGRWSRSGRSRGTTRWALKFDEKASGQRQKSYFPQRENRTQVRKLYLAYSRFVWLSFFHARSISIFDRETQSRLLSCLFLSVRREESP